MNFNTFSGFTGGTLRNFIGLQTLATVTETAFLLNTDTGSGSTAILSVPTQTSIVGSKSPLDINVNRGLSQQGEAPVLGRSVQRPEFNTGSFNGLPFRLRISGVGLAVANAAASITVKIYCGTTANIGTAANVFGSTGAIATVAGGQYNFSLESTLLWDLASGLLGGFYQSLGNFGTASTYVAPVTANAAPLAVAALSGLTFFATAKWGNAVGGTLQVNEFALERL
jgi:hypothetical protein